MSGPCSCQTHYVFTAHGTKRECERLFNAAIHALRAHGEQTFVWEDQVKRLLYDRLHAWGSLRLREEQLYRSAQRATAPIVTACPPSAWTRISRSCAARGRPVASFLLQCDSQKRTMKHCHFYLWCHRPARSSLCGHQYRQNAGHGCTMGGTSIIRSMAVGNMTDTIKKGMKDVTNAVKHAAEKGKDAAVGAVDKGKVVAAQGAEKVKEQTDRAAEKVKEA
jgi:hypothetical protein